MNEIPVWLAYAAVPLDQVPAHLREEVRQHREEAAAEKGVTRRTMTDEQINAGAKFYPHSTDENGTVSHPCIELGGNEYGDGAMQAYVYAENGQLVVSLHYDTAGPTGDDGSGPWAYYGDGTQIPTVVIGGGGETVWEASASTDRPRMLQTGAPLRITGGRWSGFTGHIEHICKSGSYKVRLDTTVPGIPGRLVPVQRYEAESA